jgi:hypothetical protein
MKTLHLLSVMKNLSEKKSRVHLAYNSCDVILSTTMRVLVLLLDSSRIESTVLVTRIVNPTTYKIIKILYTNRIQTVTSYATNPVTKRARRARKNWTALPPPSDPFQQKSRGYWLLHYVCELLLLGPLILDPFPHKSTRAST